MKIFPPGLPRFLLLLAPVLLWGFAAQSLGQESPPAAAVAYTIILDEPAPAARVGQVPRAASEISVAPAYTFPELQITGRRQMSGSVQRQRNPALSPHHLLVLAYNARDAEVFRATVHDPRVIRAEFLGENGQNTSPAVLTRPTASLHFALPADDTISRIDVLQPSWKDGVLEFRGVGSVISP